MISCCIFDLDGVVVDTAKYHFRAWHELAAELGFDFTPEAGEATKGVSRRASLDIVLGCGGLADRFSEEEKCRMAERKNARYLELVAGMTPREVLPGVTEFLDEVHRSGRKVVLGSASKNTRVILERCALADQFDAVVDGTMISRAKPDPEVFLRGAELVGADPAQCVVFEDARAGIEAARAGGMHAVGVGLGADLARAEWQIASFAGLHLSDVLQAISK